MGAEQGQSLLLIAKAAYDGPDRRRQRITPTNQSQRMQLHYSIAQSAWQVKKPAKGQEDYKNV
nr:MAG TPA: hypothetical protein [Caudoviricetes sp.]